MGKNSKKSSAVTPSPSSSPSPTNVETGMEGEKLSLPDLKSKLLFDKDVQQRLDKIMEFYEEHKKLAETTPTAISNSNEAKKLLVDITSDIDKIKKSIEKMKETQEEQAVMIDDIDQDRRFPYLLLHGLAEDLEGEHPPKFMAAKIAEVLKKKVNLPNITEYEISDCYRLGKYNKGATTSDGRAKCRPVLVRFTRLVVRREVWLRKKQLKGTGLLLTEFLTPQRQELLRAARAAAGDRKAWSYNGVIYMLGQDDKKVKINKISDIEKVKVSASN